MALTKFYPWFLKEQNPSCISWIKTNNQPNRNVKPDNMITEEEVQKLAGVLNNARDRTLTYTLHDSGCRIGELLALRNKDIEFDEYGAILSVTGKTGYRRVGLLAIPSPISESSRIRILSGMIQMHASSVASNRRTGEISLSMPMCTSSRGKVCRMQR